MSIDTQEQALAEARKPNVPRIRWCKSARVFLVDYGSLHFSLSPRNAASLRDYLSEALAAFADADKRAFQPAKEK